MTGGHRGNKGKVDEGGLLVPVILEWPARIKQPRITKLRCNTYDVYPTLLAIDPKETADLAAKESDRVKQMSKDLTAWLKSVTQSLNGEDYASR